MGLIKERKLTGWGLKVGTDLEVHEVTWRPPQAQECRQFQMTVPW